MSKPASIPIPAPTARLFHGIDPAALGTIEHRGFLIHRVLDEGDRDDLRWLVQVVGEAGIVAHLDRHGGRGLSARSRSFCERVFGRRLCESPRAACWSFSCTVRPDPRRTIP